MIDLIVLLILAVPIGLAIRYVYKAKKRGIHCIGCPDGATCCGSCHSSRPEEDSQKGCSCGCSDSSKAS